MANNSSYSRPGSSSSAGNNHSTANVREATNLREATINRRGNGIQTYVVRSQDPNERNRERNAYFAQQQRERELAGLSYDRWVAAGMPNSLDSTSMSSYTPQPRRSFTWTGSNTLGRRGTSGGRRTRKHRKASKKSRRVHRK